MEADRVMEQYHNSLTSNRAKTMQVAMINESNNN
jgi:hypothetical protein